MAGRGVGGGVWVGCNLVVGRVGACGEDVLKVGIGV
jgi:hypothetical protein